MGRPKRLEEYQTISCELPKKLATKVRVHCHKKGLILNNFTKEALEEKMERIKKGE